MVAIAEAAAKGVQKGAGFGGKQALAKVAGGAARVLGSMPLLVAEIMGLCNRWEWDDPLNTGVWEGH